MNDGNDGGGGNDGIVGNDGKRLAGGSGRLLHGAAGSAWAWIGALGLILALTSAGLQDDDGETGFKTITKKDVLEHLTQVAAPEMEGRDSPSAGQRRVAQYIEDRLIELGFEPIRDDSYRMPFGLDYVVPVEDKCGLEFKREEGESPERLEYAEEFIPLPVCRGEAEGGVVFAGFGITDSRERYDDLKSAKVKGKIAIILEGEPRHRKLFDGPEVTRDADVYRKLKNLEDAGAIGVLVVRRKPPEATDGSDGEPLAPPSLGYRYTWGNWADRTRYSPPRREMEIPVCEISMGAATRLLGEDVQKIAQRIDKGGKPQKREPEGLYLYMTTEFESQDVSVENVAGILRGADEGLANEYVVLGAHYDHVGVDPMGRIGFGADDNGSGTTALLELAEAFSVSRPRRSVLLVWFAAEEDGLIGSQRFCDDPPVPRDAMVAMFNMDMVGRGSESEVFVIGLHANPGFDKLLKGAKKLHPAKIKTIETKKGRDLWERSDHYNFHKIGVPVLFFTEDLADNPEYHTPRDTIELINTEKIARTARFIFNATWICANDPERPGKPEQ